LSVAIRRFFLRPFHLIINSCFCAPIHRDRFPFRVPAHGFLQLYNGKAETPSDVLKLSATLFANLHRIVQHVIRSLLLSRINEDAPLALKDLAAAVWIVREQADLNFRSCSFLNVRSRAFAATVPRSTPDSKLLLHPFGERYHYVYETLCR
jgi:hypothetical protein